jgi:hypothetical protein
VTKLQLHQAALAAGDEDAQTLELVCARANIKVLKQPGSYNPNGARETIAVTSIKSLIERQGPIVARAVLEVIANAERGPITSPQIKAAELLMTEPKYREMITPEDLTTAIIDLLFSAEDEAKQLTISHKWPFWKALAITWFGKCKKRRQQLARVA